MLGTLKRNFYSYYTNFEEFVTRNETNEANKINKKMLIFYTHCLLVFYVIYPFYNPFISVSQALKSQLYIGFQFLALATRKYPIMVSCYIISSLTSLYICSIRPIDGLKSIAIALIQHNYSYLFNKNKLLKTLFVLISLILVNKAQLRVQKILDENDYDAIREIILNLQYSWPLLYLVNTVSTLYLTNKYWQAFQEKQEAQKALESKNQELSEVNQKLQATLKLLEQTNKDLKDAMRARELFIASVSHELRNPLNSMLGNIELLSLDVKEPKCQSMLDSCKICGEVLLGLINNVLDVAKINAEKLELHIEPENLHRVIEKLWMLSTIKMRQKGIKGHLLIGKNVPKYVEVDSHRLNQILLNLIGNATKFTQNGFIKVIVSWKKEGDTETLNDPSGDQVGELMMEESNKSAINFSKNKDWYSIQEKSTINRVSIPSEITEREQLSAHSEMQRSVLNRSFCSKTFSFLNAMNFKRFNESDEQIQQKLFSHFPYPSGYKGILKIEVIDSGCGIAASSLQRLFHPFSQADSSITAKFGGTGLGLYITQQLVQKMGGQIYVQSQKNVGSKFWVSIPTQTAIKLENSAQLEEDKNKTPLLMKNLKSIRGLIVDDDPLNQLILINYLNKFAILADVASNGQEALEKFKNNEPNYYSFIFTDIEMPIMDGLSACKIIRKYEQKMKITPSCPIVVVTANSSDAEKRKCLDPDGEIRAHSFFRKPFTFEQCQTFIKTLAR